MKTKYSHGIRCVDCDKSLTDENIFRRPIHWFDDEEIIYELVCEKCLLGEKDE